MKTFFLKSIVVVAGTIVIFILITLGKIYEPFRKFNWDLIPENNLTNSVCLRAQMDHVVKSAEFKSCTFLIAGSSMSLNNISGLTVSKRTGESVYNLSAWGMKPSNIIELLSVLDKKKIKYLMVAFNNTDFQNSGVDIDANAAGEFMDRNQPKIERYWLFLKQMRLSTFFSDITFRKTFSNKSNDYQSLNFDKTGSVLFEPVGFIIDKKRWNEYIDTLGFYVFYHNVNRLSSLCRVNGITMFLVYLPYRSDLLTENYRRQNQAVSNALKSSFNSDFIDLHNIYIPKEEYCDSHHLFKDGAERITDMFLDSIGVYK